MGRMHAKGNTEIALTLDEAAKTLGVTKGTLETELKEHPDLYRRIAFKNNRLLLPEDIVTFKKSYGHTQKRHVSKVGMLRKRKKLTAKQQEQQESQDEKSNQLEINYENSPIDTKANDTLEYALTGECPSIWLQVTN